jgi:hypothetical protein
VHRPADVFAHRKLGAFPTEPFFMFYTEEPVSPIAGEMKKTYELMRAAGQRLRQREAVEYSPRGCSLTRSESLCYA